MYTEVPMKKVLSGVAVLAALMTVAAAMAAGAAKNCLPTRGMESTTPQNDGAAILFKMRDGSVWRNDLHGRCPDLKFNGYAWTIRNPGDTVCENEQTIRV